MALVYMLLLFIAFILLALVYAQGKAVHIYIEALGKVEDRLTKLIKDKN